MMLTRADRAAADRDRSVSYPTGPEVVSRADAPVRASDLTETAFLRRVIGSFGVERVMWASDYTQVRAETNQAWAHALYYLLDSDMLSDLEKSWILGRSVRQALRWPRPLGSPAAN
jgi:hypothetical protein